MIDTLEVAEELENLGFPEQQAKGLVRVIGRELHEQLVTKDDLRDELERRLRTLATKDDLERFATKDDFKRFATTDNFKRFPTKEDLKDFPTRADPKGFAMKDDLKDFPTRADPKGLATKEDLVRMENRLLIWMISAIGVATGIISLVATYAH